MRYFLSAMIVFLAVTIPWEARSENEAPQKEGVKISIDEILKKMEKQYAVKGFSANFEQNSVIKAMDISDLAAGTILIKPPGKMRWEYMAPEKQSIITDGETLWVYRPIDKQVMKGKAPEFFGGGKGAGFLSDIRTIRKSFTVNYEKDDGEYYIVKLVPKGKKYDIKSIFLYVSKARFTVNKVVSTNSYGDETLIEFSDYRFDVEPGDAEFHFEIPPDVDVLKLEQ